MEASAIADSTSISWAVSVNCEPTKAIIVAFVITATNPRMLSTVNHEPMSSHCVAVGPVRVYMWMAWFSYSRPHPLRQGKRATMHARVRHAR